MDTYTTEYIIQGFYPDGSEFRAEITTNSLTDAAILAQGALKVTTLKETHLIEAKTGWHAAKFANR